MIIVYLIGWETKNHIKETDSLLFLVNKFINVYYFLHSNLKSASIELVKNIN